MKLTSNAVTTFVSIAIILILLADFGMKKYALDNEDNSSALVEFSLIEIALVPICYHVLRNANGQ